MQIVCSNCQAKYNVPDDKIPAGGAKGKCTKCGSALKFKLNSEIRPEEINDSPARSSITSTEKKINSCLDPGTNQDEQVVKSQSQQRSDMKKCPFCAEMIIKEAVLCRYCNNNISGNVTLQDKAYVITNGAFVIEKRNTILVLSVIIISIILLKYMPLGTTTDEKKINANLGDNAAKAGQHNEKSKINDNIKYSNPIDALKKIESASELSVTIGDYNKYILEAKIAIDSTCGSDKSEICKYISKSLENHIDNLYVWGKALRSSDKYAIVGYDYNENVQRIKKEYNIGGTTPTEGMWYDHNEAQKIFSKASSNLAMAKSLMNTP